MVAAAIVGVATSVTPDTNTPTAASNYMVLQGDFEYVAGAADMGAISGRAQLVRSALSASSKFAFAIDMEATADFHLKPTTAPPGKFSLSLQAGLFSGMHNCSTTASFRCDTDSDCSGHGYCNHDLRCVCHDEYVCEDCKQRVLRIEPSNLICVDSDPARAGYPTLGDCPAYLDRHGRGYIYTNPEGSHDIVLLYNLQNVIPKGSVIHAASLVLNEGVSSKSGSLHNTAGNEIAVHKTSTDWTPGVTRNKDVPEAQELLGTLTIPAACCEANQYNHYCLQAYRPITADCTTTVVPRLDITSEIESALTGWLSGTLAIRLHMITSPGAFAFSKPAKVNIEIFGEPSIFTTTPTTQTAGATQTTSTTATATRPVVPPATGTDGSSDSVHNHTGFIVGLSVLGVLVIVLAILASRG
eukprot:gene128-18671_t